MGASIITREEINLGKKHRVAWVGKDHKDHIWLPPNEWTG